MEPTRRTDKLRKLFVRNHIVDIKELFQALETNSRMTVFRHLNQIGYLSSYSHAGRYYTLEYIPRFDSNGLWHFREVSFSRFGTLKSTIIHLIENASTGMTHRELAKLLHLSVHHTLRNLVNSNIVSREHAEKLFLYVSLDSEVSSLQISRTKEQIEAFPRVRPLNPLETIEVLLELLHSEDWEPTTICVRLRARKINVLQRQVEAVLTSYNLKKKP